MRGKRGKAAHNMSMSRVLPAGALWGDYLASLPSALSCLFGEWSCCGGALLLKCVTVCCNWCCLLQLTLVSFLRVPYGVAIIGSLPTLVGLFLREPCFRSAFWWMTVSCSVLQCVAVCCSVMTCVVVRCIVLQCVAVCCSVVHSWQCVAVRYSAMQCIAVYCLLQCVAVHL